MIFLILPILHIIACCSFMIHRPKGEKRKRRCTEYRNSLELKRMDNFCTSKVTSGHNVILGSIPSSIFENNLGTFAINRKLYSKKTWFL